MRTLLALVIVLASACRYTGAYTCERDEQCRSRAGAGVCQLATGLCSFADATCPLGQRYGETAGEVANECVENAPALDAPTVFDPAQCPAGFTAIAADLTSRYRILPALGTTATFPDYMTACEAQKPGLTHAVILDTDAEAAALGAVLGANAGQHYIGAIQSPTATGAGTDWINADGTPLLASLWSAANTEPDDQAGGETDHAEQAGAFNMSGTFDVPGFAQLPVICECDGVPVAPMFRTYLTTNDFD